jgi:hypothetical protein
MNNKKTYSDPYELEQLGYSHGENYLNYIETSIFNEPYFLEYINGFIKGLKDYAEISKEYQLIFKQNKTLKN